MSDQTTEVCSNNIKTLTDEDVKLIVYKYKNENEGVSVLNYCLRNASDKMIGFLSDYWKLAVDISTNNYDRETVHFFIKAISRTNSAKAALAREIKLFQREFIYYDLIKNKFSVAGIKPWSPKFVTALDGDMVFEDLNILQYKTRNKFEGFDMAHTLQALQTLARFHASCIIFEEFKSKELNRPYSINEEYEQHFDECVYMKTHPWFIQCMEGALETVKCFSKYNKSVEIMNLIEKRWRNIWTSALNFCDASSEHRNVICHRDLWNNNIMFHYKQVGEDNFEPDDCVLVDFQTVRYQPPAGDVMVLLYSNLDPQFREKNMDMLIDYYYQQLQIILSSHDMSIHNFIPKEKFLTSVKDHRPWGLIMSACILPMTWIDDELTLATFNDNAQYEDIFTKNKASFLIKMVQNSKEYRRKIMEIFDEIVVKYCITDQAETGKTKL